MIAEVEAAAQAADAAATKAHADALDPTASVDAAKVAAAVATANLSRDRLRAALPRLQQQLKQLQAAEYAIAWRADYEKVKTERDKAAALLRERYPEIVEELVAMMTSIAAADAEVLRVNAAAPLGDQPRRGRAVGARARSPRIASQGRPFLSDPLGFSLAS